MPGDLSLGRPFPLRPFTPELDPPVVLTRNQSSTLEHRGRSTLRQHSQISDQQRIFGGENGDGSDLCDEMIRVVIGLFGGVDYIDPL